MTHMTNEVVAKCKICQKANYDRHLQEQILGETPIPSYTGVLLHIDIYSTDKKIFLTCVDKLWKFSIVQPIASRTIVYVQTAISQLINFYRRTKTIYCDNEPSIKSETIKTLLRNQFNIQIVNAAPHHSTSNGQEERYHSTLAKIARYLKIERGIKDTVELILLATIEYKKTIDSVTN